MLISQGNLAGFELAKYVVRQETIIDTRSEWVEIIIVQCNN